MRRSAGQLDLEDVRAPIAGVGTPTPASLRRRAGQCPGVGDLGRTDETAPGDLAPGQQENRQQPDRDHVVAVPGHAGPTRTRC